MSGTHTPGPWEARRVNHKGGTRWDIGRSEAGPSYTVAQTLKGRKVSTENDANARLIAASPDLFAALLGWIQYMEDPSEGGADTEEQLLDAMRLAIARAEGTSP